MIFFSFTKKKFAVEVFVNFVSNTMLGASGILQNILIGNYYQADGLGVFSWSLAVYMICSVISTFGIQVSVVKFVAEYKENTESLSEIISTALWLVLFCSISITLILLLLLPVCLNKQLIRQETLPVFRNILISLPFFSLNKVLMGILNGLRRMYMLAFAQSMRAILLISFSMYLIAMDQSLDIVILAFFFTEIVLSLWLFVFSSLSSHVFSSVAVIPNSFWLKKHLFFGGKSAFTTSVGELNKNIDMLILGYFSTNYHVGIYGLASTVAKGLFMISSAIQMSFNPIISYTYSKYGTEQLVVYIYKIYKFTFLTSIATSVIAVIGYPILISLFVRDVSFHISIPVYYILLCGVIPMTIFCFSGAVLVMCGYATEQFQLMVIVLLFNIFCNILLVPTIDVYGAAVSTTLSYIVLVVLLNYFVQKKLRINLFKIFIESILYAKQKNRI